MHDGAVVETVKFLREGIMGRSRIWLKKTQRFSLIPSRPGVVNIQHWGVGSRS
jgi:hypothetical protein